MNYTKEFEDWWAATYQGKLSPEVLIMELAFKDVAYQAWRQQQITIDELFETIESIEEDLNNGYVRK